MSSTEKNADKPDPRGVAASRGQSGGTAAQVNHGSSHRNRSRTGDKGSPPEGDKPSAPPRKVTLAVGREPTFYIGGGNGVALVEGPLLELGWKRITDRHNENFKLKWVECKNTINYNAFKEGDQLVNHIPNCNLLTNKMGLLTSLQSYERFNASLKRRETKLKLSDFMPETYRLDDPREREAFLEAFSDDIWICKPTGMNQGKGIYLVRDLDEFKVTLQERDERLQQTRRPHRANMGRVIQRYLGSPLLLEGRKFDIRAYMLIANTAPYLVLYHKGYVRLSLQDYDIKNDDLTAHLTNQYIQKKDPNYKEDKESTAWSMDKFNDYINEQVAPELELEQDWVYNSLTTRMKQIMMYCFNAVKNRLHCKIGYFDLYGLDFMVDKEMRVWLIEVNVNPSLATNCEALREVIPGVVRETLYLTLECYEKSRRSQALLPLHSLNAFTILHNGCTKSRDRAATSGPSREGPLPRNSISPVRRQRSPSKETQGHSSLRVSSKLQGHTEARVKAAGWMTPKATSRPSPLQAPPAVAPLPATPALRGALPAIGDEVEKGAVSNSLTVTDQVKLKMTHTGDKQTSSNPPADLATPGETQAQPPGQIQGQSQVQTQVQSPGQIQGQTHGQLQGQPQGQAQGQPQGQTQDQPQNTTQGQTQNQESKSPAGQNAQTSNMAKESISETGETKDNQNSPEQTAVVVDSKRKLELPALGKPKVSGSRIRPTLRPTRSTRSRTPDRGN